MLARLPLRGLLAVLLLLAVAGASRGEENGATEGNPDWRAAYEETRELVEALKAELDEMKRIRAAQKELMAWNEERVRLGLTTMTLRPELCLEEWNGQWCRLFPATFGVRQEALR